MKHVHTISKYVQNMKPFQNNRKIHVCTKYETCATQDMSYETQDCIKY